MDTAIYLNEHLGSLTMLTGNDATLIEGYQESFDLMVADIDSAKEFVHVEFYILVLDDATRPFFDALARATARGVQVRVLSDFISGYMFPKRQATRSFLAKIVAEVAPYAPASPLERAVATSGSAKPQETGRRR